MSFWGITARNDGQKAVMRALLNDKPFLFLTGPAGTGKTLISVAAGLHRVVESQDFRKLIYTRMQTQLGDNVGALPGDINEKTYPFIRPFLDNFELLSDKAALEYLVMGDERRRKVFFDPIQTMRGGSFHHAFLMADEAQNLDVQTITGVATRLALGSKIVFLGNFAQIDTERLRKPERNGLYRLLNGLYESGKEAAQYFDHVNLTEVERHPAVDLVERILRNHDMPAEFEALEARGNVL